MRLLATADLHYNHPRGRPLADDVIDQMNAAGGDVLLVVGDTATADGDALERCLSRFHFNGPRLFVAGNHELWTARDDSHAILADELPRRVRALGWQWLQTEPFVSGDVAVVGSVGWYDYSLAATRLGIPRRFYEAKVSPGAAARFSQHAPLLAEADDIPPIAHSVLGRWNDGVHVKLHRTDEQFLEELLQTVKRDLERVRDAREVIAAIHHLPFRELLPPSKSDQWDFAKAYLGSETIGRLLLEYPHVRRVFCGHSHFASEATVGHIHAVNIGSGYGWKTYAAVEI